MPKLKNKRRAKGLDTLSKISGISKKKIKEIWVTVKKNNELLDDCPFHIFKPIDDPSLSRRFICENCKGTVGATQKSWYEKGLSHDSPSHRYQQQFKDY